jgi:hypothetical protein
MELPFRKLRFTQFMLSEHQLTENCKQFEKGAIIAFGNWPNCGGCIRGLKAPIKRFLRALQQRCTVVLVDEFRTSKLCFKCHGNLVHRESLFHPTEKELKASTGETPKSQKRKVYSIFHCQSKECNGATVDRDINGARNIRQLFLDDCNSLSRHICFDRKTRKWPDKSLPPRETLLCNRNTKPLGKEPLHSLSLVKPRQFSIALTTYTTFILFVVHQDQFSPRPVRGPRVVRLVHKLRIPSLVFQSLL